ncbi:MAG: cob(I)yrinic acid a,c-diamide adenosyltransferase [Candidatus Aenigmarchaeota archaeon]|nr:cob(I)yrinic acid a,c-diamide adenosyltransferase [Candidatus Aenigmarchaeota archaeon]
MPWTFKKQHGGDRGETSLHVGPRVSKDSLRVTAYGEVDELNSFIGLVRARTENEKINEILKKIQNDLFVVGADLATPIGLKSDAMRVTEENVKYVDRTMEEFLEQLEPINQFILPSGSPAASLLHICRTICRRAERSAVALKKEEAVNEEVIRYLNRLSDLLFVLARIENKREGVEEEYWEK